MSNFPRVTIEARGVDWESFRPDNEVWALALMVFLGEPPGALLQMFEIVVCSPSWLGRRGWEDSDGIWFHMRGNDYAIPWPCVVLTESRADMLREAVEDIVFRCFAEAEGDVDRFMHSMRRFVQWDGEPVPSVMPP